jgi:hypothetical protein
MKINRLCYVAAVVLAAALVNNASAWPDYQWTGLGGDNMWTNVHNWTNLTTHVVDLPENELTNPAVQVDQANGSTVCIIPAGYTVDLNSGAPGAPLYNTLFGPEFGMTFNIQGTLKYNWMMAPVQNDPAPGARSIMNMYNGSSLLTGGAGLGVGYPWWWYYDGPYVTLNMYGNAQLSVPFLAVGGHVNMYGTSAAYVTNSVFTGNIGVLSDGTASFVMGGGTLNLPNGYNTQAVQPGNTVTDLVTRGVLRVYGKGYDTVDLVINTNGSDPILKTVVSPVPLGGSLQRVYFQPLSLASVHVGTVEQAALVGDYPSVTGVLLSSAEPGVDPATFTHPVYTSSKPNVVTVDTNGMLTAVGSGTATLTATVGVLNGTNSLSITVTPVNATLVHRYSFNEASGTTASDSVGGATWNGTVQGAAAFNGSGQVVMSGANADYVLLPAGIASNMDEISIEVWASFGTTAANNFGNLFAFGFSDSDPLSATYADGGNYITFTSHTTTGGAQLNFGQNTPGFNGERNAVIGNTLDGQSGLQVVGVYSPSAGTQAFYTNAVLAASASMFNALTDPVAYSGPTLNNRSVLNYRLGADPNNYIGHSLYLTDPGLNGSVDEFRIYNGPLTTSQMAADNALGPNQLRGTSLAAVTLKVTRSGNNLVFSWPTSSALVTLLSSPTLGPSATWTPVAVPNGALTVSGPNYQLTLPMSPAIQFYRLSL